MPRTLPVTRCGSPEGEGRRSENVARRLRRTTHRHRVQRRGGRPESLIVSDEDPNRAVNAILTGCANNEIVDTQRAAEDCRLGRQDNMSASLSGRELKGKQRRDIEKVKWRCAPGGRSPQTRDGNERATKTNTWIALVDSCRIVHAHFVDPVNP